MKYPRIFKKPKVTIGYQRQEPRLTDEEILEIRRKMNIDIHKKVKHPHAYQSVV